MRILVVLSRDEVSLLCGRPIARRNWWRSAGRTPVDLQASLDESGTRRFPAACRDRAWGPSEGCVRTLHGTRRTAADPVIARLRRRCGSRRGNDHALRSQGGRELQRVHVIPPLPAAAVAILQHRIEALPCAGNGPLFTTDSFKHETVRINKHCSHGQTENHNKRPAFSNSFTRLKSSG